MYKSWGKKAKNIGLAVGMLCRFAKKSYLCRFISNMDALMEQLLQYVWKHRMLPLTPLTTVEGERVEVLDPGLWNHDAGPDFFNAKLRIGTQDWVGNVEVHLRSSDWYRHGHEDDLAYENVVLHVVGEADREVTTPSGRPLPQIVLAVPAEVEANFRQLMAEEAYPPCYRVIPTLPSVKVRSWLNALTVERLEQKIERIDTLLQRTGGDWERVLFVTLARALGFGVNSDAFEQWAAMIDLTQVGKHRDQLEQVEAFFLGTAGLLERAHGEGIDEARRALWEREWRFLCSKFGLKTSDTLRWKYMRMRPQNFPHVRLLQLARMYHEGRASLSRLVAARDVEGIREMFHEALPQLQATSLDLLLINTAAPVLFAHGRQHDCEERMDMAFKLLESVRAESNYITRAWRQAGLSVSTAADSQALIQLRKRYCDRRDCLRCRFGAEYLRQQ